MRSCVAVCVVFALCAVAVLARPVHDDALIEEVNRSGKWLAGRNARFEGVAMEDAVKLLGSRQKQSRLPKKVHTIVGDIPDSFDSRQQWPNCIHPIRDQAQCGSCWAFGATEALSDRFCIQENVNVVLSPQDLVSCDSSDDGCDGGYLDNAWQYMKQTGVVADKCLPYTSGDGSVPSCSKRCTGSGQWAKYQAKSAYDVSSSVANIQTELMKNGPIEVAFDVYEDFFSYKGGVYTHQSGGLAGGHAVKLIGWGSLNNVPYWLVANSWGTSWGMSGFFMIKRGVDECGIESNCVAGMAGSAPSSVPMDKPLDEEAPILDEEIIAHVNKHASWKAAHNKRFEGVSIKEARRLLGAKIATIKKTAPVVLHAKNLPSSFDSRQQWPGCVHPIRNQEQCGSCWAFAATEALSDRLCIASNGQVNVVLSPQDLVSCDNTDEGCGGGYLQNAWDFMASSGVVAESCMPYTSGEGSVAPCPGSSCSGSGSWSPYYVQSGTVNTFTDAESIATQVMQYGPVEAAFTVYQDFFSYKSGVYSHQSGQSVGGHAVKIIGWGNDNGQDYWLVANSWGTDWGMDGFFEIAKGKNECGIESDVVAGQAKV